MEHPSIWISAITAGLAQEQSTDILSETPAMKTTSRGMTVCVALLLALLKSYQV